MTEEKKITYLLECEDGTRKKITVPANWKVTFGPVARTSGGERANAYKYKMPIALRFYENQTQQRAIFTNVVAFRDMSIPLEIEKVKTQDRAGIFEVDGAKKRMSVQARVKEWIDADEEDNDIPKQLMNKWKDTMDIDDFEELEDD